MEDSPFDRIKRFVIIAIGLFYLAFVLVDTLTLIFGSPSGFQRLGSLWVALLLLTFGFLKSAFFELRKGAHGKGVFGKYTKKMLEEVSLPESEVRRSIFVIDSLDPVGTRYSLKEIQVFFADLEDYISANVVSNELIIGALATLQWGYGHLISCLLHGSGWIEC